MECVCAREKGNGRSTLSSLSRWLALVLSKKQQNIPAPSVAAAEPCTGFGQLARVGKTWVEGKTRVEGAERCGEEASTTVRTGTKLGRSSGRVLSLL